MQIQVPHPQADYLNTKQYHFRWYEQGGSVVLHEQFIDRAMFGVVSPGLYSASSVVFTKPADVNKTYEVTVAAKNAAGETAESARSAPFGLVELPSVPGIPVVLNPAG